MDNILLVDGRPETITRLSGLLGEGRDLKNEPFSEGRSLSDISLVIVEGNTQAKSLQDKVRSLRRAAHFRYLPLILLKDEEDTAPEHHYILSGATEVLSREVQSSVCRRVLAGYLASPRKPLPAEMVYLKPFVSAAGNVLSTMAGLQANLMEIYFSNEMKIFGDISGVIGLSGDVEGAVAVTFYWDLGQEIISRIMGVEDGIPGPELIHDGVGELVNMISGAAKTQLADTPYHFQLSLPTVVLGSGHEIGHPQEAYVASLVFDCMERSFALQVCLVPKDRD